MGIFDRLDRMASRAMDRTMADTFQLTPMKTSPNGRPEVDFARQAITARGVYSTVPGPAGVQTGERRPSAENNDLRALVLWQRADAVLSALTVPRDAKARRYGELAEPARSKAGGGFQC